jgi:hypothetical protein
LLFAFVELESALGNTDEEVVGHEACPLETAEVETDVEGGFVTFGSGAEVIWGAVAGFRRSKGGEEGEGELAAADLGAISGSPAPTGLPAGLGGGGGTPPRFGTPNSVMEKSSLRKAKDSVMGGGSWPCITPRMFMALMAQNEPEKHKT